MTSTEAGGQYKAQNKGEYSFYVMVVYFNLHRLLLFTANSSLYFLYINLSITKDGGLKFSEHITIIFTAMPMQNYLV